MADEKKVIDGQENEDTGDQKQENKKSKKGLVKKVFTIGEKIVTGGMAAIGCYALFKALKPEPKSTSDSNE